MDAKRVQKETIGETPVWQREYRKSNRSFVAKKRPVLVLDSGKETIGNANALDTAREHRKYEGCTKRL